MITTSELDDWQQLVKHPAFLRLREHATKQWTEQITSYIGMAVADRDDTMALNKMRQLIAAKAAVEQLMTYPDERIATLSAKREQQLKSNASRRGGL